MDVLLLFFVFCCTVILIRYYESVRKFSDANKLPGPKPLPLFGNLFEFGGNLVEILRNQTRLFKVYGPVVRIWLGGRLKIMLADAGKIETFLNSTKHTKKSFSYDALIMWLGNGLINSAGSHWRKHRKLITPTFHFKILESSTDFMNTNAKILIEKLSGETEKKSINIYPFINLYALDVISETAMCTKVNAQTNANCDYVLAVKGYMSIVFKRWFSFIAQYDVLFKMTRDYQRQLAYVDTLRSFTTEVIKDRKASWGNNCNDVIDDDCGRKRKVAFLDALLELEKEGNTLTDEELRDEVDTFMFAGHDTVSSAISFCLFSLAKHPEIQDRVFEESHNVIGTDLSADITLNDIHNLKYLDMVVKESLRLHPPVPHIEREIEENICIDGLCIPKGTVIQIMIFHLHRNEKYYADPEKFDPDRFLPENCVGRHPYAYVPFSAGPRNCIGQKYAMISTKAAVVKILRKYEIRLAEPYVEPVLSNYGILESVNGINIQLIKRVAK